MPAQPADGGSSSSSRDGAIGELRVVRAAFSSPSTTPTTSASHRVDGGALMDVGCYCVSGSRLLAGEPESVFGAGVLGETGTDWVFTGSMRFPGDVLAQFDCGTALPERDELEAIGSEGSLFLDDPWHCREPVIELRRGRRRRAHRARAGRLVPARAREPRRRGRRDGAAPARPRRRAGPGARDRGALRLRGDGGCDAALAGSVHSPGTRSRELPDVRHP